MFKNRTFKLSLLAAFAGVVILGFQNCAPTKFKESPSVAGLSFSAGAVDSDIASEDPILIGPQSEMQAEEQGDDQSQARPSDDVASIDNPQSTEMPEDETPAKETASEEVSTPAKETASEEVATPAKETASEEVATPAKGNSPEEVAVGKSDKTPSITKVPAGESTEDAEGLVECDLGRPNSKVTLNGILKKGSNASASRVCMSENACLKIINDFAAKRDCSLAKGAAVSDAQSDAQCTQIFPGSRGTCKNASQLSDDEVATILSSME